MYGTIKKTYFVPHKILFLVICALRPTGSQEIVRQEREVSEAVWLPMDEFLKNGSKAWFLS